MNLTTLSTSAILDLLESTVGRDDKALRAAIGAELKSRPEPDEATVDRLEAILIKDLKTRSTEELISNLHVLDFEDPVFGCILDELEIRDEPSKELQKRMMRTIADKMIFLAVKSEDHLAAVVEAIREHGDAFGMSVEIIEMPVTKH